MARVLYFRPTGVLLFVRLGVIKFGEFSLDCVRYELLCGDRTLKLEKIPMELLTLMATSEGRLVSRQEIIKHLWGDNVFVDTEHGINTAIRKIRQALKDDPEQPRYVQTVTGKGYRFIAEISSSSLAPVAMQEGFPVASSRKAAARTSKRKLLLVLAAGIVLVLVSAFTFNAAGVRDRLFSRGQSSPIGSIAVLPLTNLSGDASLDYFADGMTDELITMLAKNSSLRVVSRTSAMQYKGVNRPVRDIARELGVDGVLEGSVAKSPNQVHMNVQLIHASSDTHLWAESYDRDPKDSSSLPTEISRAIAHELKLPAAIASPLKQINPEAHDAYLHGRYVWFTSDAVLSRKYFEQAIQLQPDYAAAWGGLADSYVAAAAEGLIPSSPGLEKGGEAARRAVELDDSLAEAHTALAAYYFFTWDWRNAEREIVRATKLDPNMSEGHHLYSYILTVLQRPEESLRESKRSMELDSFARPWALGHTYIHVRRFDDAVAELRLRAQGWGNDALVHLFLSQAFWLKHDWQDSQREFEEGLRLMGQPEKALAAHRAFIAGGEKAVERWGTIDLEARARKKYVSPFDLAMQYGYLGDKNQTLKYLEESFREHSAWLAFIQNEPVLDFVHSEPRYQAIVNKMGLPPAK